MNFFSSLLCKIGHVARPRGSAKKEGRGLVVGMAIMIFIGFIASRVMCHIHDASHS